MVTELIRDNRKLVDRIHKKYIDQVVGVMSRKKVRFLSRTTRHQTACLNKIDPTLHCFWRLKCASVVDMTGDFIMARSEVIMTSYGALTAAFKISVNLF